MSVQDSCAPWSFLRVSLKALLSFPGSVFSNAQEEDLGGRDMFKRHPGHSYLVLTALMAQGLLVWG